MKSSESNIDVELSGKNKKIEMKIPNKNIGLSQWPWHTSECWQIFGGTEYTEFQSAAHHIEVPSENAVWIIIFDDNFVNLARF